MGHVKMVEQGTSGPISAAFRYTVAFLLALGLLRALMLFVHDPLLAVANNYDMIRVQACIEAYPVREASIAPEANSYEAPISRYRFVSGVGATCFLTSEAIFAFLSFPAMAMEGAARASQEFSIRWVGLMKLLALVATGLLVSRAFLLADCKRAAVLHAGIFSVVLADPAVTLYLNTFYAEFAALLFAYILTALLLLDIARHQPAGRAWQVLLFVCPALLAISKVQHALTPMIILTAVLLAGAFSGRRMRKASLVLVLAGSMAGAMAQVTYLQSEGMQKMARANIVNTVMFGLLENASNPESTLAQLNLPAQCIDSIGKNWFTPGMQEGQHCPEVFAVSRIDVAGALLSDPPMLMRVVTQAIERSRPWIPIYLGLVEGESMGRLPPYMYTVSATLDRVPTPMFVVAFLVTPLFGGLLAWLAGRSGQHLASAAIAVLSLSPLPLLGVVALGDGFADTAKQAHLATAMFLAAMLSISVYLLHLGGTLALARRP